MSYEVKDFNLRKIIFQTGYLEEAFNIMVRQRQKYNHKRVYVYRKSSYKSNNSHVVYCPCGCDMRNYLKKIKNFRGIKLDKITDVDKLLVFYEKEREYVSDVYIPIVYKKPTPKQTSFYIKKT